LFSLPPQSGHFRGDFSASGDGIYVKTFYRLHREDALRDLEIRHLLRKGEKK